MPGMFQQLEERGFVMEADEQGGGAGGGGASEGGEAAAGGSITVGDKTLSLKEAQEQLGNYGKLQGEYTRSQRRISELEGRLDERRNSQPPKEERPAEPARDFDKEWADLDRYDDDYEQKAAALRRAERESIEQSMDAKLEKVEKRIQARSNVSERRSEIDKANEQTFTEALANPDLIPSEVKSALTKDELQALKVDYQNHIGEEYGTYDEQAGKFIRSQRAVEAALYAVPSVRKKLIAHREAKARDEGYRGRYDRERAGEASPSNTRPVTTPAENMSFTETVHWLRAQPSNVRKQYLRQNKEFGEEYLRRRREHVTANA